MNFIKTEIESLYYIEFLTSFDHRGSFLKPFSKKLFDDFGIKFEIKEFFYTVSKKNTVRGMHFQLPPKAVSKLIIPISGRCIDVVVDLRKKSKTFMKFKSFYLDHNDNVGIYVPKGFAHGFKALDDEFTIAYLASEEFSKKHDFGIKYDSFGFNWGNDLIISQKDLLLPKLDEFQNKDVF